MPISLVLDQGVPRDVASLFRNLGYECMHVGEIGMWKASDGEILAFALERSAIIVTLDADFHAILAVAGARGPSVIRVRIEGLRAAGIFELVKHILDVFAADLKRGSLITVKAQKITCHWLPIGGSL